MTERQVFISELRTALEKRGVPDEDAARYLNDHFYFVLVKDPAWSDVLTKIDVIADGIAGQVRQRAKMTQKEGEFAEMPKPTEAEISAEPATQQIPDESGAAEMEIKAKRSNFFVAPSLSVEEPAPSERTVTIDSVFDEIFDEAAEEPTAEINIVLPDENEIVPPASIQTAEEIMLGEHTQTVDTLSEEQIAAQSPVSEYDEEYSDYIYSENEYGSEQNNLPEYAEEPLEEVDFDSDLSEAVPVEGDVPQSRLPDYIEEKPIPNSKLFWVLFGVSSPLWIAVLAVGLAVFVAVWISLSALIVALIAAMIAVIVVGCAAALMGLIYGVIQVVSPVAFSTGIYNIGLGVISVGTAMALGIIIYNLALRLMPWLIKLVGKLFKFTLKQLKRLFNHLRRECAKQ